MIRPGRDILQFIGAPHIYIGIEGKVFGTRRESRAERSSDHILVNCEFVLVDDFRPRHSFKPGIQLYRRFAYKI